MKSDSVYEPESHYFPFSLFAVSLSMTTFTLWSGSKIQTRPLMSHFCSISNHILVPLILNHYDKPLVIQNSLLASANIYLECLLKSIITSFNIALLVQARSQEPVQFKRPSV